MSISLTNFVEEQDYYYSPKWLARGEEHYFFKKAQPLAIDRETDSGFSIASNTISNKFNLKRTYFVDQCHSSSYLTLDAEKLDLNAPVAQADAIIVNNYQNKLNIAIAVYTADCLPILLQANALRAIVHAGWQGLANQVVTKIIREFQLEDQEIEILLGPHARVQDYQFGVDDLSKINRGVFEAREGQYYLNLAESLAAQLADFKVKVEFSDLSTISNNQLASYRRAPALKQRNISLYSL